MVLFHQPDGKEPTPPSTGEAQKHLTHARQSEMRIRRAMQTMNPQDPQRKIMESFCKFLHKHPAIGPEVVSDVQTRKETEKPLMAFEEQFNGVYFLLDGGITIETQGETRSMSAPAICGEVGAITGKRTATVRAAGSVSYIFISKELYNAFLEEAVIPELSKLILDRVPPVRDSIVGTSRAQLQGLMGKEYPEGLKPTDQETERKDALLFWTLKYGIAPHYTREALEEAKRIIGGDNEAWPHFSRDC